jgi:hypothetical protein
MGGFGSTAEAGRSLLPSNFAPPNVFDNLFGRRRWQDRKMQGNNEPGFIASRSYGTKSSQVFSLRPERGLDVMKI